MLKICDSSVRMFSKVVLSSHALAATAALAPTPLQQHQLQTLFDNRYVVIDDWMPHAQTDAIREDALAVNSFGGGFDSCVGNSRGGGGRLETSIRKSHQCLLYPPPSNRAGSVDTRASLISAVNGLRSQLQASDFMKLPYLEPFETELTYLLYPVGGHYKRHLDVSVKRDGWKPQGRLSEDGGSFSGGRTRRCISFILYLNRHWDAADNGCLRVFPAYQSGDGTEASQHADFTKDILPEGGRLVIMMSSDVDHCVLVTHAERQCVVGWFREYGEGRVPDEDVMSLRTWQDSESQA